MAQPINPKVTAATAGSLAMQAVIGLLNAYALPPFGLPEIPPLTVAAPLISLAAFLAGYYWPDRQRVTLQVPPVGLALVVLTAALCGSAPAAAQTRAPRVSDSVPQFTPAAMVKARTSTSFPGLATVPGALLPSGNAQSWWGWRASVSYLAVDLRSGDPLPGLQLSGCYGYSYRPAWFNLPTQVLAGADVCVGGGLVSTQREDGGPSYRAQVVSALVLRSAFFEVGAGPVVSYGPGGAEVSGVLLLGFPLGLLEPAGAPAAQPDATTAGQGARQL